MSAQPSLLELFESGAAVGAIHESPVPSLRARRAPNPFRKFFGPCVQHCGSTETVQLVWCHFCGHIGCWDWHKEHNH